MSSTSELINQLVANPLRADQTLTKYDQSQAGCGRGHHRGVIIPSLLLTPLTSEGTAGAIATNSAVVYYGIYFPNLSLHELYASFQMQYNDIITITPKKTLSTDLVEYLDVNIYYRGIQAVQPPFTLTNTYDGTITETVSAYQYTVNLPSIVYGCSQSAIADTVSKLAKCGNNHANPTGPTSPSVIVRTVPTDWVNPNGSDPNGSNPTQGLNRTSFLFRAQTGPGLATAIAINPFSNQYFDFNDYYQVDYYRGVGTKGPYYSLANPAPNSYYFFPLKVDYPINATARAQYQSVVALFELNPLNTRQEVGPYFFFASTPPGSPVDCAYSCVKYNVDNGFDNRAATYFTSKPTIVLPGSEVVVVQYNHKLEPGRCQYSSITIYGGNVGTNLNQLLAVTTIPDNEIPNTVSLIVIYTNVSPSPAVIVVGERIYQYPASAYDNAQPMTVFVRLTEP